MKLIIKAVSSPPQGGVVGAPQPQTLKVVGGISQPDGDTLKPFGHDLTLVFEGGAIPTQILREPGDKRSLPGAATLQLTADGANATVNVPPPLMGSPSNPTGKVWAVSGGLVSDEFDFPVGKG